MNDEPKLEGERVATGPRAGAAPQPSESAPAVPRSKRPLIERLGLALIAFFFGALFGAVALAAWSGGEPFLAAMGATGCLMTLWVGGMTLFRS